MTWKGCIFCRDNDCVLESDLSVNSNYLSGPLSYIGLKHLGMKSILVQGLLNTAWTSAENIRLGVSWIYFVSFTHRAGFDK